MKDWIEYMMIGYTVNVYFLNQTCFYDVIMLHQAPSSLQLCKIAKQYI